MALRPTPGHRPPSFLAHSASPPAACPASSTCLPLTSGPMTAGLRPPSPPPPGLPSRPAPAFAPHPTCNSQMIPSKPDPGLVLVALTSLGVKAEVFSGIHGPEMIHHPSLHSPVIFLDLCPPTLPFTHLAPATLATSLLPLPVIPCAPMCPRSSITSQAKPSLDAWSPCNPVPGHPSPDAALSVCQRLSVLDAVHIHTLFCHCLSSLHSVSSVRTRATCCAHSCVPSTLSWHQCILAACLSEARMHE